MFELTGQRKAFCFICLDFNMLFIIKVLERKHTKSVEVSLFIRVELLQINIRSFGMFFFYISIKGICMSENEMQFVVLSTFIRPKHDAVWCPVVKLLL